MYRLKLSINLLPVTFHAGPSFVFEPCAAKRHSAQLPCASERRNVYRRSHKGDVQHILDSLNLACSWHQAND